MLYLSGEDGRMYGREERRRKENEKRGKGRRGVERYEKGKLTSALNSVNSSPRQSNSMMGCWVGGEE